MTEFFDQAVFLKYLAALVAIFNPLYGIPVFLSMTAGQSKSERFRTALIVTASVTVIALVTVVFGAEILAVFGIDVPSFRIAGGIIIFGAGLSMINTVQPSTADRAATDDGHKRGKNIAIVPLALPLTIGPGAIAITIVFSHQLSEGSEIVTLGAGVLIACGFVGLGLIFADSISRLLGETMMSVMTRVMAIILVAVSIEMVLTGVFDAVDARYPDLLQSPTAN